MTSWAETMRQVEVRAAARCEYCRMLQALQGATFHVEHIIPDSRGGPSELDNLAWACPGCNLRKTNRTDAVDPQTGEVVPLFHPRKDCWSVHFRFEGYRLVGQTATGRATVELLDLNHPRRLLIRRAEELFELFPPDS
jgi:hypothetical protein